MWFDMVKRYVFSVEEGFESSNLIADGGCELFGRHLDFATAKALDIGKARVGTNGDVVFLAGEDGLVHDQRVTERISIAGTSLLKRGIPSVEAASNISMVDQRYQLLVRTAFEVSISFSQVDVDLDGVLNRRHRGVEYRG
jgi:hypothetical protein